MIFMSSVYVLCTYTHSDGDNEDEDADDEDNAEDDDDDDDDDDEDKKKNDKNDDPEQELGKCCDYCDARVVTLCMFKIVQTVLHLLHIL